MPKRDAIVITGASSGIGAAFARALAAPGRTLALLGRDTGRLDEVAIACRAKGAQCQIASVDVNDRPAMAAFLTAFEREHGIDLLIPSAGVMIGRPGDDAIESGERAFAMLQTNTLAVIDAVQFALPGMRRRGGGEIVLLSSLAGLSPLPDAPAYSASKAALLLYGLALRDAVEPLGIKVVVACPGYVSTPLLARHRGGRPGEMPADDAVARILTGLDRNTSLIGFPWWLFWMSRVALLSPEPVRRFVTRLFRFHFDG
jgi:short-subunit dehydrogenase